MSDLSFWEALRKMVVTEQARTTMQLTGGLQSSETTNGFPINFSLEKEYWSRVGYLRGLAAALGMGQIVVSDMLSQDIEKPVERGYDA